MRNRLKREHRIPLAVVLDLTMMTDDRGRRLFNRSTLSNWIYGGVNGIRLEFMEVGGCLFTTFEALERFFDALTENPVSVNQYRRVHEAISHQIAVTRIMSEILDVPLIDARESHRPRRCA